MALGLEPSSARQPGPGLLAGATLIARSGDGPYWIAPAVVTAVSGGLATVRVLLVEIRR